MKKKKMICSNTLFINPSELEWEINVENTETQNIWIIRCKTSLISHSKRSQLIVCPLCWLRFFQFLKNLFNTQNICWYSIIHSTPFKFQMSNIYLHVYIRFLSIPYTCHGSFISVMNVRILQFTIKHIS